MQRQRRLVAAAAARWPRGAKRKPIRAKLQHKGRRRRALRSSRGCDRGIACGAARVRHRGTGATAQGPSALRGVSQAGLQRCVPGSKRGSGPGGAAASAAAMRSCAALGVGRGMHATWRRSSSGRGSGCASSWPSSAAGAAAAAHAATACSPSRRARLGLRGASAAAAPDMGHEARMGRTRCGGHLSRPRGRRPAWLHDDGLVTERRRCA